MRGVRGKKGENATVADYAFVWYNSVLFEWIFFPAVLDVKVHRVKQSPLTRFWTFRL
jgi:hypothetical protein